MNKLLIIFLVFLFFSCHDSKTAKENVRLKQEIESLKQEREQTNSVKFLWTVIYCQTATYSYDPLNGKEEYSNIKNSIYWSDIAEYSNVDENLEYRLQDQLESKIRQELQKALYSVKERKTYVFDSYKEASEFKFQTINQ